jgi:hypothetical protein
MYLLVRALRECAVVSGEFGQVERFGGEAGRGSSEGDNNGDELS